MMSLEPLFPVCVFPNPSMRTKILSGGRASWGQDVKLFCCGRKRGRLWHRDCSQRGLLRCDPGVEPLKHIQGGLEYLRKTPDLIWLKNDAPCSRKNLSLYPQN